ncbi:O-acetyl-ADP-ribose deacetylase (regulator of RNase III), contains Macro domain [Peptoclostridium litorale DSM 5388]|uniref:Macro domain-containing protein n=1 Tax=Peptoclostridium litorale DSM 5388 TaxID=1121324 RepID=A0A069RI11_PEPLI|nr:O-acetyl-ADP-ribose deacetylase [Peptoclostridium litorale]KDR96654.1 macro domain-containing protein [Peptoclostridium litorale DSM 5388]SIN68031.1 O-acetyl-ADP-ribose deacetylase (regulator of RNase III), contains Macro domain [Peptoclostridium litorale DSM 5388]
MEKKVENATIELLNGDITKLSVDAIVNAANSSLMGGGGVDGAIHRAGGPEILRECKEIVKEQGGCPTGDAVITTAGNLPSKYVIHTVGPIWKGGFENEEHLLANCYRNSLNIAVQNGIKSIAFPNISTGVYKFPPKKAAVIAIKAVTEFIKVDDSIERVIFACFGDENYEIYKDIIEGLE